MSRPNRLNRAGRFQLHTRLGPASRSWGEPNPASSRRSLTPQPPALRFRGGCARHPGLRSGNSRWCSCTTSTYLPHDRSTERSLLERVPSHFWRQSAYRGRAPIASWVRVLPLTRLEQRGATPALGSAGAAISAVGQLSSSTALLRADLWQGDAAPLLSSHPRASAPSTNRSCSACCSGLPRLGGPGAALRAARALQLAGASFCGPHGLQPGPLDSAQRLPWFPIVARGEFLFGQLRFSVLTEWR